MNNEIRFKFPHVIISLMHVAKSCPPNFQQSKFNLIYQYFLVMYI